MLIRIHSVPFTSTHKYYSNGHETDVNKMLNVLFASFFSRAPILNFYSGLSLYCVIPFVVE